LIADFSYPLKIAAKNSKAMQELKGQRQEILMETRSFFIDLFFLLVAFLSFEFFFTIPKSFTIFGSFEGHKDASNKLITLGT
jgi:hypothetical protein